ncbi:MAG: hypothetical protein AB7G06_06310 [Bdellovibrionales bacterium]
MLKRFLVGVAALSVSNTAAFAQQAPDGPDMSIPPVTVGVDPVRGCGYNHTAIPENFAGPVIFEEPFVPCPRAPEPPSADAQPLNDPYPSLRRFLVNIGMGACGPEGARAARSARLQNGNGNTIVIIGFGRDLQARTAQLRGGELVVNFDSNPLLQCRGTSDVDLGTEQSFPDAASPGLQVTRRTPGMWLVGAPGDGIMAALPQDRDRWAAVTARALGIEFESRAPIAAPAP